METINKKVEQFKCLNPDCKHEWKEPAKNASCPKCNNKYVKWVSYKDKK